MEQNYITPLPDAYKQGYNLKYSGVSNPPEPKYQEVPL